MKTAVIFGASGFIGSHLLNLLIADNNYHKIIVVSRSALNFSHPKIENIVTDYAELSDKASQLKADEVFITLGIKPWRLDYSYPVLAAKLTKATGAKSIFVVTAIGASTNSLFTYLKWKGKIERDITALQFKHTHFFRPSLIMGNRKQFRPMEKLSIYLWHLINPLLVGKLNKYKGMRGENIAKVIHAAAQVKNAAPIKIYHWAEMNALLKH